VKRPLSLLDGHVQSFSHDFKVGIVREFEIVDACHDAGEVVVWRVWWLTGLANHSEHWGE
jgi:hypothetical protein